ncbi:YezD family protein [Sinimarinibacterium thermocellulolyticum]|uniref:YezD family protein n=1 Tax=Sinimarinibacterium thermocellulolyticum TaxID=3170016 RepID=A0ABV2A843_9GAMM
MSTAPLSPRGPRSAVLDQIAQALAGLEFGAVEITVHQGRIVQIERREKVRLESERHARPTEQHVS